MFLFILTEASPNALKEINSPLPRLIALSIPLAGEWINDKHERFLDCSVLRWLKIGDFPVKDKHETLPMYARHLVQRKITKII